jgi:hypothetical protein
MLSSSPLMGLAALGLCATFLQCASSPNVLASLPRLYLAPAPSCVQPARNPHSYRFHLQHYTELGLGPGFQLDPAVTSRLHGWNNSLFQKINQGHPFNCPYRQKTWPKYRVNASNTCMIAHK